MKRWVFLLVVTGWMAGPGLGSEIELKRMERQIFEAPAAVSNKLYHLRTKMGAEDEVEERWKNYFEQANGIDKERWALLLAMNASPPFRAPQIERSKRWMRDAGDSVESHSFRAVLASMENDPEAVIEYLDGAMQLDTGIQLLQQYWSAIAVRDGLKSGGGAELNFWLKHWEGSPDPSIRRLWIGNRLTELHVKANRLSEWIQRLENTFEESPESSWVEAGILSAAARIQLRSDRAHAWMEHAQAAGAPDAAVLILDGGFLSNRSSEAYLFELLGLDRFPPDNSYQAAYFMNIFSHMSAETRPRVMEKMKAYIGNHSAVLFQDPLALLVLVENFHKYSAGDGEFGAGTAILDALREHCEQNPKDLEAAFAHGRLLLSKKGRKNEGARVMEDFLKNAMGNLGQRVIPQDELSSRSRGNVFALRFPPLRHANEQDPEGTEFVRSTFQFPNKDRSHDQKSFPDYENWKYFHLNSGHATMGDLFLAGMFYLGEEDLARFEPIYRQWLRETNPPLPVRLSFAMKVDSQRDGTELTSEVVKTVIESDGAEEQDLIEVMEALGKRHAKPEQIRKAGVLLTAINPANRPGADMAYLRSLMEWDRDEDAKAMFAEVRKHANPENNEDQRALWSCTRRLAQVCKDESLALPLPEFLRKQREESKKKEIGKVARLLSYFQNPVPPFFAASSAERLFVYDDGLKAGGSGDVMFSWGMDMIDPALAIYESGFAYHYSPTFGTGGKFTREEIAQLAKEIADDNRAFAAVRAFYDGELKREEQLRRIEAVSKRFPDDQRLKLVVAAKAMTVGEYENAIRVAKGVDVEAGNDEWIRQAILLLSAWAEGDGKAASAAARELAKITWTKESRHWLAGQMENLGLLSEAEEMRELPGFLTK